NPPPAVLAVVPSGARGGLEPLLHGQPAAESKPYQSSFSNRKPVVSAAYLISSIDHGFPQVITTLVDGSIRARRASRVRCFGNAGLTVFSKTAFAFATSPPFATICCKSCSSLRGISSR